MRIALLITGRAARYDACLLPILQNTPYHNIDIFMSINDEPCKYYDIMQQLLAPYLKGLYIKKYEIPKDIFNIICNQIINDINNHGSHDFLKFRDSLYDILVYNLDMTECLFYILSHFIETERISREDISEILIKSYKFLKYYNNNYRPIYHLETIMYYIIKKIYGYE
jgi:hypothetical protein